MTQTWAVGDTCRRPNWRNKWANVTQEERVWSAIDSSVDGCWVWSRGTNNRGYGVIWFDGRKQLAHRVIYTMVVGPIPDGMVIDHLCRNTRCVRPDHLEAVTQLVNIARGYSPPNLNSRKTHCPAGHAYTESNTRYNKHGYRECRECKRRRNREAKARRKAARDAA